MPNFVPEKKEGGKVELRNKNGVPLIIEPRCSVCKSGFRTAIDAMLASGYNPSQIARHFEGQGISRKSISHHRDEHLDYEGAAIRAILDREAAAAQKNYEDGTERIITKQAYLEIALQKAYDQVISGDLDITAGEAVKIIEMWQKLEERYQNVGLDELRTQFNAFMQSVKTVVPPEMWERIRILTHQHLEQAGREGFISRVDAEVKELPKGSDESVDSPNG